MRAEPPRAGAVDWVLLAGVATIAVLLSTAFVAFRPDLTFTADFLVHDQGVHLLIGDRLSKGARLYADVAYPYGPIPAYVLALLAWGPGLSAVSYVALLGLQSAVFLTLMAHAIRAHSSRAVTAGVVLLALVPFSLTPGGVVGAYTNNNYIGLERILLAVLTLLWLPPWRMGLARYAVAGGVLGVWQLVKFGGAVFGGAAWLILDLVAVVATGRRRDLPAVVAPRWLLMAAAFGAVEGLRCLGVLIALPRPVAIDVIWPSFTAALYKSIPIGQRWPSSITGIELLTQYLVPIAALAILVAGAMLVRGRLDDRGAQKLALWLPVGFFVLGAAGYFGHWHTVRQYAWCLIPASAVVLNGAGARVGLLAATAAAPAVALMLKVSLLTPVAAASSPLALPHGAAIWRNDSATEVDAVVARFASATRSGSSVMVLPAGGGLYFYFGAEVPTRHLWLVPAYLRPFEVSEIQRQAASVRHLFVLGNAVGGGPAPQWDTSLDAVFGNTLATSLRARAGRVEPLGVGWWHVELAVP